MTKIILPTKTVDAVFADVSISTGRFNALLPLGTDTESIVRDFSGIERIETTDEYGIHKVFEGYTAFDSLETRQDGILFRLRKGG